MYYNGILNFKQIIIMAMNILNTRVQNIHLHMIIVVDEDITSKIKSKANEVGWTWGHNHLGLYKGYDWLLNI